MSQKNFFHLVLSTDSLSLPRPWHQKHLDERPDLFFRIEQTFPFILKATLENYLSTPVIASNYAVRASSLQKAANMSPDLFAWMSPDVTIIHHGIVDCWLIDGKPRVSIEKFAESFKQLVEGRKRWGDKKPFIIIGILPTSEKMLQKYPEQNSFIAQYNAILREIVNHPNCLFMDVENFSPQDRELAVHEDGHHLSTKGHVLYAEHLAVMIQTHFSKQAQENEKCSIS